MFEDEKWRNPNAEERKYAVSNFEHNRVKSKNSFYIVGGICALAVILFFAIWFRYKFDESLIPTLVAALAVIVIIFLIIRLMLHNVHQEAQLIEEGRFQVLYVEIKDWDDYFARYNYYEIKVANPNYPEMKASYIVNRDVYDVIRRTNEAFLVRIPREIDPNGKYAGDVWLCVKKIFAEDSLLRD